MKKLIIALSLVIFASAAYAQKPAAGAKGFTFGVQGINTFALSGNSQAGTLLFKYYVADALALRVGANYTKTGSKTVTDLTTTAGTKETIKNTSGGQFLLALGAQKSLGDGEKLEPYIGADILLGMGKGNGNKDDKTEVTDATKTASGTDVNGDFNETEIKFNTTSTIGFVPCVGFNYYFVENFAFGAEFNWGVVHTSQGDNTTTTTGQTNGVANPTVKTTGKDTFNQSVWNTRGGGNITVTVLF
jgi:hypothetical protein